MDINIKINKPKKVGYSANVTDVCIVLDRSGSMLPMTDETILSFNQFIEDQKKQPGETFVTLATFSDSYTLIHDRLPINKVPVLTREGYTASGWTALYDAMGKTIENLKGKLTKKAKVMFVVITDGKENVSRNFTNYSIKSLVEKQTKSGWEIIYIGSDPMTIQEAADIGVPLRNIAKYKEGSGGLRSVMTGVTYSLNDIRVGTYGVCGASCSVQDNIDAAYDNEKDNA